MTYTKKLRDEQIDMAEELMLQLDCAGLFNEDGCGIHDILDALAVAGLSLSEANRGIASAAYFQMLKAANPA